MLKDSNIIIGFMVDDIYSDFTKEITAGIVKALPANKNVKLVVIAGMHDDNSNTTDNIYCHRQVYNSVYMLAENSRLDGLIISMGSKEINESYKRKDIPKIYIASDIDNEIAVNYDNETGIREAVNFLVNVNGFSRICMLGGREDNKDARERKRIFIRCLEDNDIHFLEQQYENTDMSEKCHDAAQKLLDNNPDVQAIFCVNDDVARGLYEVMEKKGLIPGKDIYVFGFDNTHAAGEMIPPLSSIGADSDAIGQKAVKLLFDIMNGRKARSVNLPTRLYGRKSFPYEMYEYTTLELINVDKAFIYRMFDDCFYRYRNERIDRKAINLRRLFFEFMYKMLYAMKNCYMSIEEFDEIHRMIDIFFDNGAMGYTDAGKLVESIEKLQDGMNVIQKSVAANVMNNRLFLRMKDRAIKAQSETRIREKKNYSVLRGKMQEFLIETTNYRDESRVSDVHIIGNFDKLGLRNAALYMFDTAVDYNYVNSNSFPELIRLRCVMRSGELYIIHSDRQECPTDSIFRREELSSDCRGYVAFPVFYSNCIYGILVCELTEDILASGVYIADQLGRMLYINMNG